MTVEVVRDRHELGAYQDAWDHLVASSPAGDSFQSYEWVSSWLDAYWVGRPLSFLFVKQGESLRGVAPLLADEDAEFCCRPALALPVNDKGPGNILHDGDPHAVLTRVLEHLGTTRPQRLKLGYVRQDSATVGAMERLSGRFGLWSVTRPEAAFPIIRMPDGWDGYWKSRKARVRHELRRKESRAARAGSLDYRVITRADEFDEAIRAVRAIEVKSWKQPRGVSMTTEPGADRFYTSLLRRSADLGRLRLYLLEIDGKPVAHICGVAMRGEYHALTTGYDQACRDLSPGAILFGHAIRDVAASGYRAFDFQAGDKRWKSELANDVVRHVDLCFFKQLSVRCGYCWASEEHLKPFVRKNLPSFLAARNSIRHPQDP